jgi:hypothetical protein
MSEMTTQADGRLAPDDQPVSMAELRELWDDLKARGILFNGMTHHYLHERYGDRVYHVPGVGWFVRPVAESVPTVWVSTTSHRSRDRLAMLFRIAHEEGPGPEWGSWPDNGRPHGAYYEVPARHAEAIARIPGARVLRSAPNDLFKRW